MRDNLIAKTLGFIDDHWGKVSAFIVIGFILVIFYGPISSAVGSLFLPDVPAKPTITKHDVKNSVCLLDCAQTQILEDPENDCLLRLDNDEWMRCLTDEILLHCEKEC